MDNQANFLLHIYLLLYKAMENYRIFPQFSQVPSIYTYYHEFSTVFKILFQNKSSFEKVSLYTQFLYGTFKAFNSGIEGGIGNK